MSAVCHSFVRAAMIPSCCIRYQTIKMVVHTLICQLEKTLYEENLMGFPLSHLKVRTLIKWFNYFFQGLMHERY